MPNLQVEGTVVTVIPKTASQQKRSAIYTWLAAIGLGLPAFFDFIVHIEPSLKAAFPKHADTIGSFCQVLGSIGIGLLATQRQNSVVDATQVNLS